MNMRRKATNLFGSHRAPRLSGFAASLLNDVALPSRHRQFDVTTYNYAARANSSLAFVCFSG